MKLVHLFAALALVSCGARVGGPFSGGGDASVANCGGTGIDLWFCPGFGDLSVCPPGVVAGANCVGIAYELGPNIGTEFISAGSICVACGQGAVWTCASGGWQASAVATCSE